MIYVGLPWDYGRVKSLTDVSVWKCKDINKRSPTSNIASTMVDVSAVWETIHKRCLKSIRGVQTWKKLFPPVPLYVKKNDIPFLAQLGNYFVLSAVRAATGGWLRIVSNGGAAISRDTQDFLSPTAMVTDSECQSLRDVVCNPPTRVNEARIR